MNRMLRAGAVLVLALALAVSLSLAGCSKKQPQTAAAAPAGGSTPAAKAATVASDKPDFDLKDLDGHSVKLSALRGNVVIVDFWATWCPPCRMAMPHLQEIHEKYGDKGVKVVAIAMDDQGANVVRPFVQKNGYKFAVVLPDKQVERTFGPIRGLPTTVVVAPDGSIYKSYLGLQPPGVLLNDIAKLKPGLIS